MCFTNFAHRGAQALFFLVLGIGVLFLSLLLYVTADINLQRACITVVRRLLKTVALRQARPDRIPACLGCVCVNAVDEPVRRHQFWLDSTGSCD
jgi:hypothetical protein